MYKPRFTAVTVASALCCVFFQLSTLPGFAQEIVVKPAKTGGIYTVGEKIVWNLSIKDDSTPAIDRIAYILKKGQLTEIGKGEAILKGGTAQVETSLDTPGTVLATFTIAPPGKPVVRKLAGAIVAPTKIEPSAPRPPDFDAFWADKVRELKSLPANPVLEPVESGAPNVDYWKITLDNIRGTRIHGQLARPKNAGKSGKLPALLIVQWAGVYPLAKQWATSKAAEGWLTLNISAHDLPIDLPEEFYKQQAFGPLLNYPSIGNDDRDTSYFLRMYLSCYRAADYLASRDDWDGRTLVVMGTSQGGLQSIMIAGLHPKISGLIALVPAGCDQTGPLVGRQPGWPMWYYKTMGKDPEKVRSAMRYYDVVNFASRVHCPALVGVGLVDQTVPAAGAAAAFNQMRGPKELVVMEFSDHQGTGNTQGPYFYPRATPWLKALQSGAPPPVKPLP